MTVAVAHQGTNDSDHVLLEAVREASARGESLAVIHVRTAVDEDLEAAVAAGVSDAVERVAARAGVAAVPYELRVAAGRAAADAVALAAEHSEQLSDEEALSLFPGCFVAEALRDAVIDLDQVDAMRGLLDEMVRSVIPGSLPE